MPKSVDPEKSQFSWIKSYRGSRFLFCFYKSASKGSSRSQCLLLPGRLQLTGGSFLRNGPPSILTYLRLLRFVKYHTLFPLRKQLATWTTGMTLLFYCTITKFFIKRWVPEVNKRLPQDERSFFLLWGASYALNSIVHLYRHTYFLQLIFMVSLFSLMCTLRKDKDFAQIHTANRWTEVDINIYKPWSV